MLNLLPAKSAQPTHYTSVAVQPIPHTSPIGPKEDPRLQQLSRDGAEIPPPLEGPRIFQAMLVTPIMTNVIDDLMSKGVL
jgi:hypothetical protein